MATEKVPLGRGKESESKSGESVDANLGGEKESEKGLAKRSRGNR